MPSSSTPTWILRHSLLPQLLCSYHSYSRTPKNSVLYALSYEETCDYVWRGGSWSELSESRVAYNWEYADCYANLFRSVESKQQSLLFPLIKCSNGHT